MKDFTIIAKQEVKPAIHMFGGYVKKTFTRIEAIELLSAIQPSLLNGKNSWSRDVAREMAKELTKIKKCISGKEKFTEDGGTLISRADAASVIAATGNYAYNIDKEMAKKFSHLVTHIISNAAWDGEKAIEEAAKSTISPIEHMNLGLNSIIHDFAMTFGDYLPQEHLQELVVAGINNWLSAQLTAAIKRHTTGDDSLRAVENRNIARDGYAQLTNEFCGMQLDMQKIMGQFAW